MVLILEKWKPSLVTTNAFIVFKGPQRDGTAWKTMLCAFANEVKDCNELCNWVISYMYGHGCGAPDKERRRQLQLGRGWVVGKAVVGRSKEERSGDSGETKMKEN